jgi:hypothetical protein
MVGIWVASVKEPPWFILMKPLMLKRL